MLLARLSRLVRSQRANRNGHQHKKAPQLMQNLKNDALVGLEDVKSYRAVGGDFR